MFQNFLIYKQNLHFENLRAPNKEHAKRVLGQYLKLVKDWGLKSELDKEEMAIRNTEENEHWQEVDKNFHYE